MNRHRSLLHALALVLAACLLAACGAPAGGGGASTPTEPIVARDTATTPEPNEADARATLEAEVRATLEAERAAMEPEPTSAVVVLEPEPTEEAVPTEEPEPTEEVEEPTPEPTDEPAPAPTEEAPVEPTAEPTEAPVEEPIKPEPTEEPRVIAPTETPAAPAKRAGLLEPWWSVDTDRDGAPDQIERDAGTDPNAVDCVAKQCGKGALGAELLTKERNTLLVLDSSGSMRAKIGGETKLAVAKDALNRYVRSMDGFMNLGFMVYGHKGTSTGAGKAESCRGVDLLDPIGRVNSRTFPQTLAKFQPTGWTPIAVALGEAEAAFQGKEDGVNRIVLVSDGIETCEGDPVSVAKRLHETGIAVEIDVVGFDVAEDSADARQLREVARVTGGSYYDAKGAAELNEYFRQQGKALGETLDALICVSTTSFNTNFCEYDFTNKCVAAVNKYADKVYATNFEKWEAMREVNDRIRDRSEKRRQALDKYDEQAETLSQQRSRLLEQLNRAYENTTGR
jgi:hypothetical protein